MIATDPATGEQLVMPDTAEQYQALKDRLGHRPGNCCDNPYGPQHWPLHNLCQGGNAPGQPIRPHCTCDPCF